MRARGDFVVVYDSLELGYRQALGDTPLVVGNTRDGALVKQVIGDHKLEAVLHFAAYKAAGESVQNPAKYFDNNVQGSLQLIEAARQAGVQKFVFSSTAAVYGTPEVLPVREDAALHPENPYGESKLLVERMLKWFDTCFGVRSVVLRYFNAAGAALDGTNGGLAFCHHGPDDRTGPEAAQARAPSPVARASLAAPFTTPPDWRMGGWLAAGRSLAPGWLRRSVQAVITASALPVAAYSKAWRTFSAKTALG